MTAASPAGRPLRILMHCPQFHPLVGGYERAAARVAAELVRRGHTVQVVTERRSRAWPAAERVHGVPVRRLPCVPRRGVHTATAAASLAAFLLASARRFDVLHAHQYGTTAAVALGMARRLGWRTVLKLTGSGDDSMGAVLAGRGPLARAVRAAHRGVDACLAASATLRAEARAFGIAEARIHTVPNGVDTGCFRPADPAERAVLRRELGVGGGPLVLYVGRLSPEKGARLLVDAWERVIPATPGGQLVLVGDGPQLAELRQRLAASPAREAVRLAGAVADPTAWYRAADLFVLPSLSEGFSNALLEALGCGLPVVSTRVSGSVDVFAEAEVGELVEPGDAAALAAGMARLLALPERRHRCGQAARALAERAYSLQSVVDRLERIYAARNLPPFAAGRHSGCAA